MKPFLLAALLTPALLATASPALAQGGCVGRVLLPPVESAHGERVLEAPGRIDRIHLPPRVERTSHRMLVRPGREERVNWGPLYRIERRYVTVAGPTRYVRSPDRFETVQQPVIVQPGHYVWERRYASVVSGPPQPGQTVVSPTGLVMCRIWCPARYAMTERQVLVAHGRLMPVRTTAQRMIERRVLVRPAGFAIRRIPAEYRWVVSTRIVAPGRWVVSRTPARFGWREVRETHDGGAGWAPVVCGGPLSRPAMARMQSSLAAQGYDAGPADGIGRPQTYDALRRFQTDHRLAAGQVTVESARALGVVQ